MPKPGFTTWGGQVGWMRGAQKNLVEHPWSLTSGTWKMVLGRLYSLFFDPFGCKFGLAYFQIPFVKLWCCKECTTSWWFQPSWKILVKLDQIGSSPQVGVKIKNLWNHHPNKLRIHFFWESLTVSSTKYPSFAVLSRVATTRSSSIIWHKDVTSHRCHC